jgi:Tfp pilus assembly protein PilN
MVWLRPSRCNAYCRLANGVLIGLRLQRHGDGAEVLGHWQASSSGGRADAELLSQGQAALGGDPDTVVIYGGELERAVSLDLTMPVLPPNELQRALQFELPRHVPLALDSVRWGYRWVGQAKAGQPAHLRLVLIPDAQWQAWLAAASGLSSGVDLILPAQVALDPLLADRDVVFSDGKGTPALAFKRNDDSTRQAGFPPGKSQLEASFGGSETPLAMPNLTLGSLSALPPDQQRLFVPAVLLASYGLSREFSRDRRTLPSLPSSLAPRRNRLQKFTATTAAIWAIVLVLALVGRWSYGRWQESEAYSVQEQALRRRLGEIRLLDAKLKQVPVLHKQVTTELGHRISMLEVLGELSDVLDDHLWATKVEYKTPDVLSLMLRTEDDAPGLTQALKESVCFSNIEESKVRNTSDNSVTYTISAKVVATHLLPVATPPPPPTLPASGRGGATAPAKLPVPGTDAGTTRRHSLTPPVPPPPAVVPPPAEELVPEAPVEEPTEATEATEAPVEPAPSAGEEP